MPEGPRVLPAVRRDDVAVAEEDVLVRDEALEADRAARVELARGDADLRAEAVPEAVGEARRGVVEDAGRVHVARGTAPPRRGPP